MAHKSVGGLEVDNRFDDTQEKIAATTSASPFNGKTWIGHWQHPVGAASAHEPGYAPEKRRRIAVVPWAISTVLAVAVIALAIAAGVLGSKASTRQNQLDSCKATKTNISAPTPAAEATNTAVTTSAPTASPQSSASCAGNTPKSECSTLASSSTEFNAPSNFKFDLHCGTDYQTVALNEADIMGVYVYTFRDCVNSCAFYNTYAVQSYHSNLTCYAVSYNLNLTEQEGNCWLKAFNNTPPTTSSQVDSAVLITELK